jgi:hypothetical protein
MSMFHSRLLLLGLTMASFGEMAAAHHSFALFDRKIVAEVTGTLQHLQWTNPHVYFDVMTFDNGTNLTWTFEGGGPQQFLAHGMKKTTVKPGDRIVVRMHPLKNGAPGGELVSIRTEAGQLFILEDPRSPQSSRDTSSKPH